MPIRRAKPLPDLYEECADYDLVITPDEPLARALNRHLNQPHLGPFAIAPYRLAAGFREQADDRLAFLELISKGERNWKETAAIIDYVRACWEYTGSIDTILEYDRFNTPETREIIKQFREFDTTLRRLTEYSIDEHQDVAVIGATQLTELEYSILPSEYDSIDPFTSQTFDPPPFRIFESSSAIVDALLDSITPANADDIAIVLNEGSDFSSLVESAFEAEGIPYYGGPGFIDDPHHRTFLRLLRVAYAGRDTRVSDVRTLFAKLGITLDVEHNEKSLHDLEPERPELEWLLDFCETVDERTCSQALQAYAQTAETSLDAFHEELSALGVDAKPVTQSVIDQLEFYLQTYEVPVDRENEGVLLANATTAAYVDRPTVFYLGLDHSWTHSAPTRPWVDQATYFEQTIRQFQLLLQSGTDQYYLVQDTSGGRPVTPCLYFDELLEEDFERFSDLNAIVHTQPRNQTDAEFEKTATEIDPTEIDTISQSSLNTYVNCPRDYLFSRLLSHPDREYFAEGNLFHDFAEFYVDHQAFVDDAVIEDVVDVMLARIRPFLRDIDCKLRRTKYRLGVKTIIEFLDEHPIEEEFVTPTSGVSQNFFGEHFDRPIDSPVTEQWFEDDELGLKGKIDLIHRSDRLLDYKSGAKNSKTEVVQHATLDPVCDTPDFQALLYLTYYRQRKPNTRLEFTFFHFLETLDDAVRGELRLEDALTTIVYHPVSFEAHIAKQSVFETLQTDAAKKCQQTFSKIEYDEYRTFLEEHEIPNTRDSTELIDSEFRTALLEMLQSSVGEFKYVETGCDQACRQLIAIRNQNFFTEELDAFETFVDDRLAEVNEYRAGMERFPIEGLGDEPNYRRVDNRDLLIETND